VCGPWRERVFVYLARNECKSLRECEAAAMEEDGWMDECCARLTQFPPQQNERALLAAD
jgi:hypothetical protein